jgi:hypothetical protein
MSYAEPRSQPWPSPKLFLLLISSQQSEDLPAHHDKRRHHNHLEWPDLGRSMDGNLSSLHPNFCRRVLPGMYRLGDLQRLSVSDVRLERSSQRGCSIPSALKTPPNPKYSVFSTVPLLHAAQADAGVMIPSKIAPEDKEVAVAFQRAMYACCSWVRRCTIAFAEVGLRLSSRTAVFPSGIALEKKGSMDGKWGSPVMLIRCETVPMPRSMKESMRFAQSSGCSGVSL